MQRSRLLKWLLDIIARLMAKPEGSAANEADHIRRIFEVAAKHALHPFARARRRTRDGASAAGRENPTIFRIANDE